MSGLSRGARNPASRRTLVRADETTGAEGGKRGGGGRGSRLRVLALRPTTAVGVAAGPAEVRAAAGAGGVGRGGGAGGAEAGALAAGRWYGAALAASRVARDLG